MLWCVKEHLPVAVHPQITPSFTPPNEEEAVALQIASDYLTHAGTQFASFLLGCPRLDGDTVLLAEFSNSMLSGAALCAELVHVAERRADR
jgi:hypothetical protein